MIIAGMDLLPKFIPDKVLCREIHQYLTMDLSNKTDEIIYLDDKKLIQARMMTIKLDKDFQSDFESHRRFVDLHCVLTGQEIMQVTDVLALAEKQPYDINQDVIKYNITSENLKIVDTVVLQSGKFAIFFPRDGHRGGVIPLFEKMDTKNVIKKIVFKIDIGFFL